MHLYTHGSRVMQQKNVLPVVTSLNPEDTTARGLGSKIVRALWVGGMAYWVSPVYHRDTNQARASVRSCMRKKVDSTYAALQPCVSSSLSWLSGFMCLRGSICAEDETTYSILGLSIDFWVFKIKTLKGQVGVKTKSLGLWVSRDWVKTESSEDAKPD